MSSLSTAAGVVRMDGPSGALVTGGGRGLGLAICRRLARDGAPVVVTDVDAEVVAEAVAALCGEGLRAEGDVLDVADPASVEAVIARWDDALGLATVVNNAGVAFASPLAETAPERWDRLMAINLRGPFLVIRAVAPRMVARGSGAIVNVASTSSFTASSQPMAAYDVSKAGVRMLTQSAARELGPHGVRVNAVAPGTMDTALVRALFPDAPAEELIGSRIPLGRLGDPAEIAEAVAFLADPAAAYVTGHVLVVDGGWLA